MRLWTIRWSCRLKAWNSLRAAKSIDIEEIITELETAAESGQALRALVSEELPEASWQNREELDALLEKLSKPAEPTRPEPAPAPVSTLEPELEPDAVVQSGSTLSAVEYTAQTSGELVGTNPLFYGNTFNNVSMLPLHPEADQFQARQRRVASWITAVGALVAAIAVVGFRY